MAEAERPRRTDGDAADAPVSKLTREERGDVEEKRPPRAAVLHEVIRREGEQELARTASALIWSSLAAGLSMGFSMLARALLHRHLPDFEGRFLIECAGYSAGFLIVVVSRQQLFTENTMTVVLPLMSRPSVDKLYALLRLWSIVFVGNLVGVALFAFGLIHLDQFDTPTQQAFSTLGEDVMRNGPWQMLTKGIGAGWLIAMMVWMLAGYDETKIAIIVIATYLIALGGFTHIIVGSAETFYLVFTGALSFPDYVLRFALPTLAGNIVGGSGIFALISHAQVRNDAD